MPSLRIYRPTRNTKNSVASFAFYNLERGAVSRTSLKQRTHTISNPLLPAKKLGGAVLRQRSVPNILFYVHLRWVWAGSGHETARPACALIGPSWWAERHRSRGRRFSMARVYSFPCFCAVTVRLAGLRGYGRLCDGITCAVKRHGSRSLVKLIIFLCCSLDMSIGVVSKIIDF